MSGEQLFGVLCFFFGVVLIIDALRRWP